MFDLSRVPKDLRKLTETEYADLFTRFPDRLLAVATDPKTIKGQKYGVTTGIMYMLPHEASGYNICPIASIAKCHEPCLNSAGRGVFTSVQVGRLRKTLMFFQYRKEFKALLIKDIKRIIRIAERKNMIPMVRLNGTSDIKWEIIFPEIFTMFPDVQFYDYTKIPNRNVDYISNYDLTFSYSGVKEYQQFVDKAIANKERIAVVFKDKNRIPKKFLGLKVVDGDDSDIRPYDPMNVVVALYAKGKAVHDDSGFVVNN